MRKVCLLGLGLCLVFSLALTGYAQEKTASANAAINLAKALKTVQEKCDYLLAQAKLFYDSKQFQEVVNITQYILKLDKNSLDAKNLLEKAKAQLATLAQQKANELKGKIGGLVK